MFKWATTLFDDTTAVGDVASFATLSAVPMATTWFDDARAVGGTALVANLRAGSMAISCLHHDQLGPRQYPAGLRPRCNVSVALRRCHGFSSFVETFIPTPIVISREVMFLQAHLGRHTAPRSCLCEDWGADIDWLIDCTLRFFASRVLATACSSCSSAFPFQSQGQIALGLFLKAFSSYFAPVSPRVFARVRSDVALLSATTPC